MKSTFIICLYDVYGETKSVHWAWNGEKKINEFLEENKVLLSQATDVMLVAVKSYRLMEIYQFDVAFDDENEVFFVPRPIQTDGLTEAFIHWK